MARVLHRVEVVEVAEELVEAVDRRQELVQVAQVVLAELAGGVAHRLQRRRDGRRLAGMPIGAPAWPTVVMPVRIGSSPVMKFGAAGRAARLGVVVGEAHALGGEPVEVRRPPGHDALVVGADVEPADVVAHDEDDVRFLCSGLAERWKRQNGSKKGEGDAEKQPGRARLHIHEGRFLSELNSAMNR